MRPSRIPVLLLVAAAAPALAGDAGPERDPFLAALAGKSGPDAVAAPSFDPEVAALSWTLRPRREIVDALASRLLRGEAKGWFDSAMALPVLPITPSRIPEDFLPGKAEVEDRLAAWVPADAAAVFFGSLTDAEGALDGLAKFLPRAIPDLFCDDGIWERDPLRRAMERLLLPVIWQSNPGARTGTRQVALVVSDPDLLWAPEIALVAEVDDASLVRFHRQSSLSWTDRGLRHLRIDELDATTDDGSVRSFFAMEGGVAVWSTSRTLRGRILDAGRGKAASLTSPDRRAYALARRTFPASEEGTLFVIPDQFLRRLSSPGIRARRAGELRCEAVRLVAEARALRLFPDARAAARDGTMGDTEPAIACPAGGDISSQARDTGSACSVHGTVASPVPLGEIAGKGPCTADVTALVELGRLGTPELWWDMPLAMRWRRGALDLLEAAGRPWSEFLEVKGPPHVGDLGWWIENMNGRMELLHERVESAALPGALERLTGLRPVTRLRNRYGIFWEKRPEARVSGGVLRLRLGGEWGEGPEGGLFTQGLILEWR